MTRAVGYEFSVKYHWVVLERLRRCLLSLACFDIPGQEHSKGLRRARTTFRFLLSTARHHLRIKLCDVYLLLRWFRLGFERCDNLRRRGKLLLMGRLLGLLKAKDH